ncbi:hypothetical protein J4405_01420 [Candidatus Woesearchaeota archaeon]|nr:hypothetical protein [Candidatus Woesearchaeota archaeon]
MRILKALKKLHKVVTGTIINIVNFILLLPVYFIGVGITSIIAKLFKKGFLNLKKENKKSYWTNNEVKKGEIEDYYRQF